MNKADCFHLGYVAKLHGFKGEVSLFFDVTNPEDYIDLEFVYIDINDHLTPFFIEGFKYKNKGYAAVKFEGIETENDAKAILRKSLFLPAEVLPKLKGNQYYDHEVIDYTVIDGKFGKVGVLKQVMDYSSNPLLQVFHGDKEVLIPIFEGLVEKLDRTNKIMYINAPEGLIEMYI